MKDAFKDNYILFTSIIGILMLCIIVGFIVADLISFPYTFNEGYKGTPDGWLGFWGGFLGGLLGTVAVIFVAYIQNGEQRTLLNKQLAEQSRLNDIALNLEKSKMKNELIITILSEINTLKSEIKLLEEDLNILHSGSFLQVHQYSDFLMFEDIFYKLKDTINDKMDRIDKIIDHITNLSSVFREDINKLSDLKFIRYRIIYVDELSTYKNFDSKFVKEKILKSKIEYQRVKDLINSFEKELSKEALNNLK